MCLVKCLVFVIVVFNFISAQEDVETDDNLQYQFFPVTGDKLQFKVRASNDAHIAFSLHPLESDPMYEVVIGGWGNTKSVIRRRVCSQPEKDGRQTPQYLDDNDFRSFWVNWDMGILTVGREGEKTPFLSWRDPDPFSIGYVGVHTGFGSTGVWKIKNFSTNVSKGAHEEYELKTGDNVKYEFVSISGNTLRFNVRARNDAHVALTTHPWESGPMYEIVIGGWGNSKSVIRRRYCEQPERDSAHTPQYLNEKEFRGFWARWNNGIIQVGRDGETSPFLSWHDSEPFSATFVGVHTGYGSTGTWKIKNVSNEPSNIINDVATGDNLQYQFFPVTSTSAEFKVHAKNDAHVALTTNARESGPMYEVVIGGWGNTKSVIRRKTCFAWEKDEAQTPQIISAVEGRWFWVRWEGGFIQVGRENEEKPFMSWRDPEPLPVGYVGVHTGFGSTGVWEIDSVGNGERKSVSSGDNLNYQYFPISSNSARFKVRATNDAHIGLSSESRDMDPMYEVVIGGWGNTKSVIRRKACFQPQKDEVSTPRYLHENEFRGFWVRWDNGRIMVGKEGDGTPFMSWHDLEPLPVAYMGVHTGFGSTGSWKILNASRGDAVEHVETGDNTKYQYFSISGKTVQFIVRARNDVHVGLSANPWDTDPMYEIVIGGWGNTKSVIRRLCCFPAEKNEVQTLQILNDGGFRGFWVRWDGGNIRAGREGETQPFMKWQDPEPFPVNYLGVHTGFGSSGTWKLGGKVSSPSKVDIVATTESPAGVPLVLPPPTPALPVCAPTLTRLRQGTACSGQTIFEENFDSLREDVWQVQQYVPIDHPELPFVSYQRSTVSVKNGYLRIYPALQQIQPGYTHYSMYGSLDLYNGCTSGQSSSCFVEASDGYTIIPPIIGGRISSKSNFAFTYGIVSVRAKLPQGDWLYPEILLEPLLKKFVYGTKNSGMLKIACARGNKELSKGSTEYGNKVLYSGPVIDTKCHDTLFVTKTSDKFWGDEFHVYSVKWTPEHIIMSVDGVEYGRVEVAGGGLRARLPKACAGPQQKGIAPFDDHFYITLGLSAGGHSEFPDSSVSKDNHAKPWKNQASKATLHFWQDIDSWYDTWELPKLIVDYVKVVAL